MKRDRKRLVFIICMMVVTGTMTACGSSKAPKDNGNYVQSNPTGAGENPSPTILPAEEEVKQPDSDTEDRNTESQEMVTPGEEDVTHDIVETGDIVDTSKQKYTYKEMKEDLEILKKKYPDRLTVNVLATTRDGNNVYEAVFGDQNASKHYIIHAGIHAREYMTSLLAMEQLEYYLEQAGTASYEGVDYETLFDDVAIHLVPMVNPDGIAISQFGLEGVTNEAIKTDIESWYNRDFANGVTSNTLATYMKRWKANANGVDLNRNFDYGFEEFVGSSNAGAEKYKGIYAASEPEAKALVDLTNRVKPVAAISYHATGSVIYWDYGQTGALRDDCLSLVKMINKVTGYEIKYAASDKQDAAGYGDWAVMVKEIPSATVEIGTGACPLEISEFPSIWERNKELWAALVSLYRE
ncbi:MAG: peptidase M14 [Lachnospiraceae bacterium]|nr:peptidase M14 [Lachnospiraceae bacterium]